MRLKEEFVTQEIDGIQFLIAMGGESFSGFARGNPTAAFIVEQLKRETSIDAIIDRMLQTYDAPREVMERDVEGILDQLRRIHALTE